MTEKIRIGALVSGSGTNLQAIIDACGRGAIDGRIVFVGSDKRDAGGLDRARKVDIPTFVVDYSAIESVQEPGNGIPPDDLDFDDLLVKQRLLNYRDNPVGARSFLF